MMLYVLATNSVRTSEVLCEYLRDRLAPGDAVHAVNSQRGGDRTDSVEIRDGENALAAVEDALGGVADVTVETHQFVRGNPPAEDVLAYADDVDADEFVIGIRDRSPTAKVVFGSVAQDILLGSNLPMRVVPREQV
ncbi:universal stress protein [Halobaculum magnesiiphilum]|uniref:Universal stress protein n=1 Tax=Halobaculum magnesiiphilum TaxID=1017351 RepID=A0A8T8WHC7_9EURY|nr:universal stress protein [Halobaculum magnesiiphilum]QZP39143.1 universal stress protein [Halobaculum magnesiiphilum]